MAKLYITDKYLSVRNQRKRVLKVRKISTRSFSYAMAMIATCTVGSCSRDQGSGKTEEKCFLDAAYTCVDASATLIGNIGRVDQVFEDEPTLEWIRSEMSQFENALSGTVTLHCNKDFIDLIRFAQRTSTVRREKMGRIAKPLRLISLELYIKEYIIPFSQRVFNLAETFGMSSKLQQRLEKSSAYLSRKEAQDAFVQNEKKHKKDMDARASLTTAKIGDVFNVAWPIEASTIDRTIIAMLEELWIVQEVHNRPETKLTPLRYCKMFPGAELKVFAVTEKKLVTVAYHRTDQNPLLGHKVSFQCEEGDQFDLPWHELYQLINADNPNVRWPELMKQRAIFENPKCPTTISSLPYNLSVGDVCVAKTPCWVTSLSPQGEEPIGVNTQIAEGHFVVINAFSAKGDQILVAAQTQITFPGISRERFEFALSVEEFRSKFNVVR